MNIALIGSAPSSIRLAPYGNPEWQIWGCSPGAYGVVPKSDMWFELHRYEPGQPWFSPEYCKFLENYPGAVWMAENIPSIKNCNVLPVKELTAKYGEHFFTSSLAWMFAMAIEAGAKKIGLWGVDMAATEEYGDQRSGCHFFAYIARQKGIEVGVPPESDLFSPRPLYGVCEIQHSWIKATSRRRELQGRLAEAQAAAKAKADEALFIAGALDDLNWSQMTWMGNVKTGERNYLEPHMLAIEAKAAPVEAKPKRKYTKRKVDKPKRKYTKRGNGVDHSVDLSRVVSPLDTLGNVTPEN